MYKAIFTWLTTPFITISSGPHNVDSPPKKKRPPPPPVECSSPAVSGAKVSRKQCSSIWSPNREIPQGEFLDLHRPTQKKRLCNYHQIQTQKIEDLEFLTRAFFCDVLSYLGCCFKAWGFIPSSLALYKSCCKKTEKLCNGFVLKSFLGAATASCTW